MDALRRHIKPGSVYRRSDLVYYSAAIDRHLAQLTSEGTLVKMSQGLYYAPQKSKFGIVPPDDHQLVRCFFRDDDFLLLSPHIFNSLGLGLTQLYRHVWVYNHKRKGSFVLNGKLFEFRLKSTFPHDLSVEYLMVELINNMADLAEDEAQVKKELTRKIEEIRADNLLMCLNKYGSGNTKKFFRPLLRDCLRNA